MARELGVPERLRAAAPEGTGKSADMLIESDRILASVCEAVIGAAYLAFGFERAAPAVVDGVRASRSRRRSSTRWTSSRVLQERLARRAEVVAYRIVSEEGPPHDRSFVAVAEVDGEEIGRGEGRTKKGAEQEAALQALDALDGGGRLDAPALDLPEGLQVVPRPHQARVRAGRRP